MATCLSVRNDGETNPGTVLFFVALAAGAFYLLNVGPMYLDNFEVKEATAEAFNAFFSAGEKPALEGLLSRLNRQNADVSHFEVGEDGIETVKPGFGLTEENVSFVFDEHSKKLTVRVVYDRIVQFKPLKKRKTYHLVVEKTGAALK